MTEAIITKTHTERLAILENLRRHGWVEVTSVESSENTYYLFESLDGSLTFALNTGEDDFYNDVILGERI